MHGFDLGCVDGSGPALSHLIFPLYNKKTFSWNRGHNSQREKIPPIKPKKQCSPKIWMIPLGRDSKDKLRNFSYKLLNKIMNRPFQNALSISTHNPEKDGQESSVFQLEQIDPESYQLSQNFFTSAQLTQQQAYQVITGKEYLYFGGIYNNTKHGLGVMITKNSLYQGNFSLNHKMGKGYMVFPNKSTYIGDFVNDKPHGHGLLTFNQEYYMGDFENGAMEGDGLWKNEKGEKYVGKWKNNKANGHGIYVTEKSHYQGYFNQFVKQGYGIQSFANGDQYRGYYQGGKPHGMGEYTWANSAHYKGQFNQGMREGQGSWISENGDQYRGNYSSDRKNGYGEFKWANGNVYKGQFCEDMREGQGEMQWNDESVYSGEWRRGLPNGKGMFKAKDEKPRFGIFEDNILIKESRSKMYQSRNELDRHSQTEILKIIPEVTRRKKSVFRRRNGKSVSVNPSSTNSTTMTFKIGRKSNNNSNYK